MGEVEKDVKVAEDDDVRVYEDNFVIVGELPQAELAVIVLIVGAILCSRVTNPGDGSDLPSGSSQCMTFAGRDGVVDEEDEVALSSRLEEALCQRYCTTNVAF